MRSLAGTEKKMTMELGGKAANIVFDDAPIDQAVEGIVNGIFFNQAEAASIKSTKAHPSHYDGIYDLMTRPSPNFTMELNMAGAPLRAAPPVQLMVSPGWTVLRDQP